MKTRIIGLTGGIGSGKTTLAGYFKSLGIPVYIADEEARQILYTPQAVQEVKEAFGEAVFTGALPDKKKLAAVVFSNADELKKLNTIIHPKVSEHFKAWVKKNSDAAFVIKEAAILFESGSHKDCDKVILVTAPQEIRVKRVTGRDGVTADAVLARMASQWSEDKKRGLSDYIIENIALEDAKKQADNILTQIKRDNN